jgi:hypothetical protein
MIKKQPLVRVVSINKALYKTKPTAKPQPTWVTAHISLEKTSLK